MTAAAELLHPAVCADMQVAAVTRCAQPTEHDEKTLQQNCPLMYMVSSLYNALSGRAAPPLSGSLGKDAGWLHHQAVGSFTAVTPATQPCS